MIDRVRALGDADGESNSKKRVLVAVPVALLVVAGTGLGTIALIDSDGQPGPTPTETPPVVEVTPVTTTPERAEPTPSREPTTDTDGRLDRSTTTPNSVQQETATETAIPPTDTSSGVRRDRDRGGVTEGTIDLETTGNTVFLAVSNVTPGSEGQGSVVVENAGTNSGRIEIGPVSVEDFENSLLPPEREAGDDATTGELSAALSIRLVVNYPDGGSVYLFGSATDYVTLRRVDGRSATSATGLGGGERATLTIEWRLSSTAGNRHQSDSVEFDAPITLRTA